MKNSFKYHTKQILILLILFLFFFIVILSFITFTNGKNYFYCNYLGKNITDLIGILSLSISFTAFASIFFSLQQSKSQRRNELKQITIDLFKELRGQHFREVRDKSWLVKSKWEKNKNGYRQKLIQAMFSDKTNSEEGINITKDQIQAIYDLIGFYSVLSLYRDNENDIQNLSYFYYGWWRKFLYELAELKDARREEDLFTEDFVLNNKIKFKQQTYVDNVSLKSMLKRLDLLCGFQDLPEDFELHRSGG